MHPAHRVQVTVVLAFLAVAATAGCGGNPNAPASRGVPAGSIVGTVSGNHPAPHVAVISAAQLSAGLAVTLDISNGLHSHGVALTAEQVKQIAAGARVAVTSSTDPHSNGSDPHNHDVTFN